MTGHPESANRLAMLRCRVADIGAPSIARIARGEAPHDAIAGHFGNDGSCRDRKAKGVSVDDGQDGTIDRRSNVAVDQRNIGAHGKYCDGVFECWTTKQLEQFVNVIAGRPQLPA